MRKVIYIVEYWFEKRDYDRFGVKLIENRGFEVEIWSLIKCSKKDYRTSEEIIYTGPELYYIENWQEFDHRVRERRNDFFLDFSGAYLESSKIKKTLIKYSCTYYNYNIGPLLPRLQSSGEVNKPSETKRRFRKMLGLLSSKKYKQVFDKIIFHLKSEAKFSKLRQRAFEREYEKNPAEIAFIATSICLKNYVIHARQIVRVHALDYDRYLETIQNPMAGIENIPDRIAVFIDQFEENHPDYWLGGMAPAIRGKEQDYYTQLNSLFQYVENKYNCEVIIALHPRADYKNNPFNGRTMIGQVTEKLINRSLLTILGCSTAINEVALFKKDFILITNNELKDLYHDDILSYEHYFNTKVLNMTNVSHYDDQSVQPYVCHYEKNRKYYDDVISLIVKEKGTPEKFFFDVVADKLIEKEKELD